MSNRRVTVCFGLLVWSVVTLASSKLHASPWNVSDTKQPYTDAAFTLTEGTWLSVDVSPDGKLIAFDLLGDIYTMPVGGGEATLVHGGPAMVRTPSFSPDGSQLLYLSDESGSDNIWRSNIDGSAAQAVSAESVDVLTSPAWGPGGRTVVATKLSSAYAGLNTSELRVFDLLGGSGLPLVASPGPSGSVHEAQFSGDGRHLYYTRNVGRASDSVFVDANHQVHAIMQRDLETGKTTELIKGFGGATTAQVSPNSENIAYVRRVKEKTVLFVYDIESGKEQPVYDDLDRDMQGEWIAQGSYYPQFDWFPDGRHIAIWGKGKFYKIDTQTGSASLIPFTANVKHRLTQVARFPQNLATDTITIKAVRHLAIAPNDRAVAFNALGRLWQKESADSAPQRLTRSNDFETEPAYSNDGNYIAYVSWDDERGSALNVLSLSRLTSQTLVRSKGVIRQPSFSHDGQSIVYQIEPGSKCMGGAHTDMGVYTVSLAAEKVQTIASAGKRPRFSPDDDRIYFLQESYLAGQPVSKVVSVDREGFQRREHALATGSDRTELTVSPDLKWIAFKENRQYYVMPLPATAPAIDVAARSTAVPVSKLTTIGGFSLTWSANSQALNWVVGDRVFRATLDGDKFLGSQVASIGLVVKSDQPSGSIAFTGARLITMAGAVIEDGAIVVEGNKIVAVGPTSETAVPPEAVHIDSRGKTIMPGLVNMHGHIEDCYYEATGAMPQKQASQYASLAYGITTNFDPYGSEIPSYAMSEMRNAGVMVGPRTVGVGTVLFGRQGKADPVYEPIFSLQDAEHVMARKSSLGGRVVKSYRQPLRSQRQQIVKAARAAGIMVAIEGESHIYNNISAILDGHSSLEHNLPVANYYDDIIQLFAHSQSASTPTLVATFGEMLGEGYIYQKYRTWEDPRIDSYVPLVNSGYSPVGQTYSAPLYARGMTSLHAADELWDIGFRSVARATKKLDDAGVLVNVGSHSQVQGLAMHWEMQLFAEGGMSNERILRAATLNGATTLGMEKSIGSLEVGKLADLIVLEKNPLVDIQHTRTVVKTMVGGRLYDSYSMDEIGNHPRARTTFYWERAHNTTTGWNSAAGSQ